MPHPAACLLPLLLLLPLSAQEPVPPAPAPTPVQDPALLVSVPIYPNSTCPIMGKKISKTLFIDIDVGRIYICCKGCDKKILRAPEIAYQTAYPTTEKIANTVCPVSHKPIGEGAVTMALQGVEFRVAGPEHKGAAIADAQVVLTRLKQHDLVEVGNRTCPVSGAPVQPNAFVLIGNHLVRLSGPEHVAAVELAPAKTLQKARDLARTEKEAGGGKDGDRGR